MSAADTCAIEPGACAALRTAPVERTAPGRLLEPERLGDHVDRLYRAALALCGSRERAEDLVQDTLERVLKRPRFLRGDNDLGYLLRALRNTFVSQRRRAWEQRELAAGDALERVEDGAPQPPEAVEARMLYEAIAALPEPFRDALVAVDVVGLRYGEAARALRVREATLTTRVFRARQKVARMLAPDGEGRIPAATASLSA